VAKKSSELVEETVLADNCNTLLTQGMSLNDKPLIQQTMFDAGKFFDQAVDDADKAFAAGLFPVAFLCSHCNSWHALPWEFLKEEIFGRRGTLDFQAFANQLKGILAYRDELNQEVSDGSDSGTDGTQQGAGQ